MATKVAYVEDYNSTLSVVVPLSRRHAVGRKSNLATHVEGVSGSENEQPPPPRALSPIQSRPVTPENNQNNRVPPKTPQRTEREYSRDRSYPKHIHQDYTVQERPSNSTPMTRRVSSHVSSSSSNATPSGSRSNSVKAKSRSSSPAVSRHQHSTTSEDCDCSQCKTTSKTSPTTQNALSSPWHLNYPPFNGSQPQHPSPYSPMYSMSPRVGYEYAYSYPSAESGDPRRRGAPARPLSYGGANPVVVSNATAWNTYGYYGHQAVTPTSTSSLYGTQYAPPALNTAVPTSAVGSQASTPYSAVAPGYPYSYQTPLEYWSQTSTGTLPASSISDYPSMAPPPIPVRKATNPRLPGGMSSSPRNPSSEYYEKTSDKYLRKYKEEYADKPSERSSERYGRKYKEEKSGKYEKYPEYSQQSSTSTRRLSQRNGAGSGQYGYLRDQAPHMPVRSTSVPPSEISSPPAPEDRRRTTTPQPTSTRNRRDSIGTSNSASTGALARLQSRSFETHSFDYDDYGRTPPTHHQRYPSRYDRYDNRYDYDQHTQAPSSRHGPSSHNMYRSSDSSGGSSGVGSGDMLYVSKGGEELGADGENESSSMRYPPMPPMKQLGNGDENENVETSGNYRYMSQTEYAPRRTYQWYDEREQLAVQHDAPKRGKGRELGDREAARRQLEYQQYAGWGNGR